MTTTRPKELKSGKVTLGRPRNASGVRTRERLMRAAAQQFSRAEFSEVRMERIASEAGLTPAAIYNHFKSKEELFISTALHMTEVNLCAIEEALNKHHTWREMLAAVLRQILHNTTGWFEYSLLTTAVQLKMLQNRERYSEMLAQRRKYIRQFERIVVAAMAEGDLPSELSVDTASQLLVGFIFNGMGTVISHRQKEDIGIIVETTMILLASAKR